MHPTRAWAYVGAGIVAASQAEAEWRENRLEAANCGRRPASAAGTLIGWATQRSRAALNAAWAGVLAADLVASIGGDAAAVARHVVISPGSRSTPLVLACASQARLQLHCILDERAAGFFALGLSRSYGRAAVLVCTSGSAAAHYYPAVLEASASGVPLLVLSADRAPEQHLCGAPQTLDQVHLFGRHVRYFADLGAPSVGLSPRPWQSRLAQALECGGGRQAWARASQCPFSGAFVAACDSAVVGAVVGGDSGRAWAAATASRGHNGAGAAGGVRRGRGAGDGAPYSAVGDSIEGTFGAPGTATRAAFGVAHFC